MSMSTIWTARTPVTTIYTKRTQPVIYQTLITGTYDDGLEYILTDENDNAIFVYDNTGYPVFSTIWNKR